MALRVLLADESSTIKKVFQLALQDFAVDVRPVNIGVDVAPVAKNFKPDIIFADVLLQKKNGYEVCAELKQDAQLRGIPVVLMWSGFMELDEDKFGASQANAQLEKPFDVAALRKLVTDLVPRTQSQKMSQFLTFPKAQVEAEKPAETAAVPARTKNGEDFAQVPIPKMKGTQGQAEKYRLNLNAEELDPDVIPVDFEMPPDNVGQVDDAMKAKDADGDSEDEFSFNETKKPAKKQAPPVIPTPAVEEVELDMEEESSVSRAPARQSSPATAAAPLAAAGALSSAQLEKIIREQSAEAIEAVVWKVIPELATQIIERELKKLLKERDAF